MSSCPRSSEASSEERGAIVVVAKCPIPGKSKTRLIPLLGEEGSTKLAKAMLSDVLLTLDQCFALDQMAKILLYAPGNEQGLETMKGILKELEISPGRWHLLPMISKDLQASDLGDLLEHALVSARQFTSGGVVFLGMDSPVLPLQDIVQGFQQASETALLCPADDGGYGMLCVPSNAPGSIFRGVHWSHILTAVSQLKALTDQGISIQVGTLMHDIDEPADVQRLCQRLASGEKVDDSKVLGSSSGAETNKVSSNHPTCLHTRQALAECSILKDSNEM